MKTVYVLGAGVDYPLGVPLAGQLLPALAAFTKGDGKDIDAALRRKLPRFRFSFDRHVSDQAETLGERLMSDSSGLSDKLLTALDKHPDQDSEVVTVLRKVIDLLKGVGDANRLDEATVEALATLAGEDLGGADHTLLKTRGLELTPTARNALGRAFRQTRGELEGQLTKDEQKALDEMVAVLTNFEELLADLFAGFYTGDTSRKTRYLYLAWIIWAFFRQQSLNARGKMQDAPNFYSNLGELGPHEHVITFNYTSLVDGVPKERLIPFHGDCLSYVRYDRGEVIAHAQDPDPAAELGKVREFIDALQIDLPKDQVLLPGIIPPIAMKPVIAPAFLDRWHLASDVLRSADLIVIVGYSFNLIDRHFNDLLRRASQARVAAVNPDAATVRGNLCNLLGVQPDALTKQAFGPFQAWRTDRLIVLQAGSGDVTKDVVASLEAGW